MKKPILIVQARMSSQRLPGKELMTVRGLPLLGYQFDTLRSMESVEEVVLATSTHRSDDPLEAFAHSMDIPVFRGSLDDVLSRYYHCAQAFQAEHIVRICGDCPLIDQQVVERVIAGYLSGECDYASNVILRTFPRGMDTEVFSMDALERAHQEAKTAREREHVTLYFYEKPKEFQLINVSQDEDLSAHRWCVDEMEDFRFVRRILRKLVDEEKEISMKSVLEILEEHPSWPDLNHHIEQRVV